MKSVLGLWKALQMQISFMFGCVPQRSLWGLSIIFRANVPLRKNKSRVAVHGRRSYMQWHMRKNFGLRRSSLFSKMPQRKMWNGKPTLQRILQMQDPFDNSKLKNLFPSYFFSAWKWKSNRVDVDYTKKACLVKKLFSVRQSAKG